MPNACTNPVATCDADPLASNCETVFGEVTCAHCYGAGGYLTIAGRWGRCTSCRGAGSHVGHRADWTREAWSRIGHAHRWWGIGGVREA